MVVERFAPSPTGLLHLGHAYSAALGWSAAHAAGGQFLLRMEDLDQSRCRPEFYAAIEEDLRWLGLTWNGTVLCQSTRMDAYNQAIARLDELGVIFGCTCTRKDLRAAASAPQDGADQDDLETVYPGTCRNSIIAEGTPRALRLNMERAIDLCGGASGVSQLTFVSLGSEIPERELALCAEKLINRIGDVVLSRKDGVPAYHLAVVVDDAHQRVSHVTRGEDLLEVTSVHRILQHLLNLPVPRYFHHKLIRDEAGKRLAKRDDARSIHSLREAGHTRYEIFDRLGLQAVPVLRE